jgi:dipeptide transport system substrate-binding protein
MSKYRSLYAAVVVALLASTPLSAKTLVFCSEGSPENFYPGVNTTGTSFDANSQIYSRIVDFERGTTNVVPGLAEKWDISEDGTIYTFHLRKGVKWQSNANFKPTRDVNADDILFAIDRQWKQDNPYFKVTSSNHSYFNDMGLPKLLKSVEKIDDYTVKITLNRPEAPFLSDLAMEYAGIQSKEYADAMLKAGTPEKIDQEPIGSGPFMLVQYQKDAVVRYRAFPEFWGGKAKIDDLIFAITPDASVRWAKLQKGECHVMPYPNPADLDAIRKDPNVQVLEQPGLNIGYLAYNTTKKPFGSARPSTWRSTRRPSSTRFISRPASRRPIRSRRPCGPTTSRSRTILTIQKRRRSCWRKPAIRTASRPTCGRCRCSGLTIRTPSASPN